MKDIEFSLEEEQEILPVYDVEFTDEEVAMLIAANPYAFPLEVNYQELWNSIPWNDLLFVANTYALTDACPFNSEFESVVYWLIANCEDASITA